MDVFDFIDPERSEQIYDRSMISIDDFAEDVYGIKLTTFQKTLLTILANTKSDKKQKRKGRTIYDNDKISSRI